MTKTVMVGDWILVLSMAGAFIVVKCCHMCTRVAYRLCCRLCKAMLTPPPSVWQFIKNKNKNYTTPNSSTYIYLPSSQILTSATTTTEVVNRRVRTPRAVFLVDATRDLSYCTLTRGRVLVRSSLMQNVFCLLMEP